MDRAGSEDPAYVRPASLARIEHADIRDENLPRRRAHLPLKSILTDVRAQLVGSASSQISYAST